MSEGSTSRALPEAFLPGLLRTMPGVKQARGWCKRLHLLCWLWSTWQKTEPVKVRDERRELWSHFFLSVADMYFPRSGRSRVLVFNCCLQSEGDPPVKAWGHSWFGFKGPNLTIFEETKCSVNNSRKQKHPLPLRKPSTNFLVGFSALSWFQFTN